MNRDITSIFNKKKGKLDRILNLARKLSHGKWSKILVTTEEKVRFEDGFLQGWLMCEKALKPRMRNKNKTNTNKVKS